MDAFCILRLLTVLILLATVNSFYQHSITNYHHRHRISSESAFLCSSSSNGGDFGDKSMPSSSSSFIASNSNSVDRKTFKRFMEVELWRTPELESLYPILCSLESACRDINRLMRRVVSDNLDGLQGARGGSTGVNIQGEDQKKLDVIANRIMKIALCCSGRVSIVASEEDDQPCLCSSVTDNAAFSGDYAAVFDPLGMLLLCVHIMCMRTRCTLI